MQGKKTRGAPVRSSSLCGWSKESLHYKGEIYQRLAAIFPDLKESPEEFLKQLAVSPATVIIRPRSSTDAERQREELSPLPSGPRTKEAIDAYLDDCRFRGCSERTIFNYGNFLYRVLKPFEKIPTDHRVVRHILSNYKGETMTTYRRYLFGFYRFMQEEYEFPTPMTKVPKPREEKRIPDHLNPEQKRNLKESKLSPRDRALTDLFADSAVRPGEVADSHGHPLRFCDIYEDHIKVTGKKGERIVPITAETRDRLLAFQGNRPSDSPVFLGKKGALTQWGIRKVIKRAFAAAGIRGVKACPYTLRHSFGGDFLAQGGDVAILQRILGHANIKTTMIYTHIADKAVMSGYQKHGPRADNHPLFALNESSPSDLAQGLPDLIDQMISLGEKARELKHALGGNGSQRLALEDHLLLLAGYRTEQSEDSQPAYLKKQLITGGRRDG